MKIDKQSNLYTIIYIVVLVVLTGSALAYTSMSLKDRQQENIACDKMRQILASLHVAVEKDSVVARFGECITDSYIVNAAGERLEGDAFAVSVAAQAKLPDAERQLPVYVATVPGAGIKYVLPVYGAGLWGPIWGYVALNADGATVYGAYFDHQGETPGLGAEIAKPQFCNQFEGKSMWYDGHLSPVAVVKKGQKHSGGDYVDGVSGGTITSKGVSAMLANCIEPYAAFLGSIRNTTEEK